MAIIINKKLESGLELVDAYAKVSSIKGDKNNIVFRVDYFMSQDTRLVNKPPVFSEDFEMMYDIDGGCVFSQCYNHLKSLPIFSNYIDLF